jgi:hypothetical protein
MLQRKAAIRTSQEERRRGSRATREAAARAAGAVACWPALLVLAAWKPSLWRDQCIRIGEWVINIEYKSSIHGFFLDNSIHGIENLASEQNRPWSLC